MGGRIKFINQITASFVRPAPFEKPPQVLLFFFFLLTQRQLRRVSKVDIIARTFSLRHCLQ